MLEAHTALALSHGDRAAATKRVGDRQYLPQPDPRRIITADVVSAGRAILALERLV